MTRPKGTPNKRTVELVTEFGNIGVVGEDVLEKDDTVELTNNVWRYVIKESLTRVGLQAMVVESIIDFGYRCVGGVAIHDIRNPLNNEYEPHFYQAMEKID